MPDEVNQRTNELLRAAFPRGGDSEADTDTDRLLQSLQPVYEAQLGLYARTQYAFYVAFQALVFVLAAAVAVSLAITVSRVMQGANPDAIIAGVGALVTGGGAVYLGKQAANAKSRYLDAIGLLKSG